MLRPIQTLILTLSLVAGTSIGFAQDNLSAAFKKSLFDADILFDEGQYLRAHVIYDSLWDLRPNDIYLQYKTGASLVYKSTERVKAYDILKDLRGNATYPEATFYMARAKHFNYDFQDAINLYNEYLETFKISGTKRIETLKLVDNCNNGIEILKRKLSVTLGILTPPSNAENSQYSPVLSPDGQKLYYTNRGPDSRGEMMDSKSKRFELGNYYEDIFVADLKPGDEKLGFYEGRSIGDHINQPGQHEAPMSVSYDNTMMFVYLSGSQAEEDINVSYRTSDTTWSAPRKMKGQVNSPHYEGHAFLAPDGKTLYFSSDKPGGLGGRDLYTATLQADSSFTEVKNLGPKINTEFNEDAPFIYVDGESMYFASEAHGSMGGYDIFYSKYDKEKGEWGDPVNLGYPINTTDDDRFYYVTKDGDWGYFSSARASGENLHDIYRIRPGTFERLNALVLLAGTVYIDEQPGVALIKILSEPEGEVVATMVSDSATGQFFNSLLPGRRYKISLLADGFQPKVEYVDVPPMTEGVMRIEHRFDFYSLSYLALHGDRINGTLQDELDTKMKFGDEGDVSGKTFGKLDYLDISPDRDYLTDEELKAGFRFRVQVGAYKNPGRFEYGFLRNVGEVEIKGCTDGVTRYLMEPKFTRRSEAEVLRMQCFEAGQWDAWITVRR